MKLLALLQGVEVFLSIELINMINIPNEDRARLIDAQWSVSSGSDPANNLYSAEIKIYAMIEVVFY